MKDLNEVLKAIRDRIAGNINTYLPEAMHLTDGCVVVDYPDIDTMKKPNMIFLVPEQESVSAQTTCVDVSSFAVKVYVICKRDTSANLTHKVVDYYEAIGKVIAHDRTISGNVDLCRVDGAEFFPAVQDNGYAGVDISLMTKRNVFYAH